MAPSPLVQRIPSMTGRQPQVHYRTLRFNKLIHAPLPFVFRWCTDYRDDDDRITDSIYHYRSEIVLREPDRIVRIITVPGTDRNRSTDVEIITLRPPNRWHLEKFSFSDDDRRLLLDPARTESDVARNAIS